MSTVLFSNFDTPSVYGEREQLVSRLASRLGARIYTSNKQLAEYAEVQTMGYFGFGLTLVVARMRGTRRLVCTGIRDQRITLWARILGMRVWWIIWNSADLERLSMPGRLWRRGMARCARAIVPFEETHAHLTSLGFRFSALTVIPSGFDQALLHQQVSIFDELADRTYRHGLSLCYVVGVISPLVKDSGIERVITAARDLRELIPHMQLIIVGDGPEKSQLMWLAKMLGVQHYVRFVGQRDVTKRWYQFFDAYVIPTDSHQLIGTGALEALALGIAVIVGKHEGFGEIFGDHDRWILPATTVQTITDALVELERNQQKTSALEQVISRRISSEFSLDSVIIRWKQELFS